MELEAASSTADAEKRPFPLFPTVIKLTGREGSHGPRVGEVSLKKAELRCEGILRVAGGSDKDI